jgi:hypothetical protein
VLRRCGVVHNVFALQCAATLGVVRRETNSWKWTAFLFGYMLTLACSRRSSPITQRSRTAPDRTVMKPKAAPHSRIALLSIASNTGAKSPGELLITFMTSAIAAF